MLEFLTHKKYFLPEFWFVFPLMLLLAAISYGYDFILITLFALEKERWMLQRECIALGVALCFFGASWLLPPSMAMEKLLLLLTGAIGGESVMVIAGSAKIRKIMKEKVSGGAQ